MKGSVDYVNVEGLSCRCRESSLKLTKIHAGSLRKNPWTHENVMEVDGMSCRRTEIRWKFKVMHEKLTTGPVDARNIEG